MTDRSRDVSEALTAIRKVRSLALQQITHIESNGGRIETTRTHATYNDDGEYVPASTAYHRDPDADRIVSLLNDFLTATKDYQRKGKGI